MNYQGFNIIKDKYQIIIWYLFFQLYLCNYNYTNIISCKKQTKPKKKN